MSDELMDLSREVRGLRDEVHKMSTAQAVSDERHKALTEFRQSTETRLDSISAGVLDLKGAVAQLAADVGKAGVAADGRVARIESRCDDCNTAVQALSQQSVKVERRVDMLEQAVAKLETATGMSRGQVATVATGTGGGIAAAVYAVGKGFGWW